MNINAIYADHLQALGGVNPESRWTDWSDRAFDRRRDIIRETLQRPELIHAATGADVQSRLDLLLFARELRLELESMDFRLHAFPVNQLMGVPNQTADGLRIPFFLTSRHALETLSDANSIVEAVVQSEEHLRQMAAAIAEGIRSGITLPREAILATRVVIRDSLRGIPVAEASEPHPIYQRVASWAERETHISRSKLREALRRLEAALSGPLRRGYEMIDAVLAEMFASGRQSFGAWDLPEGGAFYRHCLERWSGTSKTPDELHGLGIEEITRIFDEIRPLLGNTEKYASLRDAADAMRCTTDACYPNSPAGAAAYMSRVQSLVDSVFSRLEQVTSWRPLAALEIRTVEPSRQSGALYAEFYPATADGKLPSLYLINTGDMSRLPRSEIAALAFHESVPGHHLQLCTTMERTDLADFRRRPFLYESYCEGWAMYSEQLGCELLADVLSPAERLGCLSRRLWMAARLVVDTGVHALRWSREEAVRFFRAHTFAPFQMIEQEVDRISVWPGQATAYHVGYLAFSRLRDLRSGTDRARLPSPGFHDRLFQLGPVPADMLMSAFDEKV